MREQRSFSTQDLIYVFCSAAWINSIFTNTEIIFAPNSLILFSLAFCLIPLDYATNTIWDRFSSYINNNEFNKSYISILIDIVRVMFLTFIIAYIFIPIYGIEGNGKNQYNMYILFIGSFLILNLLWNASTLNNNAINFSLENYKKLFREYKKSTDIVEKSKNTSKTTETTIIDIFQHVNAAIFLYIFPFSGIILVIISLSNIFFVSFIEIDQEICGNITKIFFVSQCILKAMHLIVIPIMNRNLSTAIKLKEDINDTVVDAYVYDIKNDLYIKKKVFLFDIVTFRSECYRSDTYRNYPGKVNLLKDVYDLYSIHLICKHGNKIIGVARITPAINGELPLKKNINVESITNNDLELGRFVVSQTKRNGSVLLKLLYLCREALRCETNLGNGAIYADVIKNVKFSLKPATYVNAGFAVTNHTYYDHDYDLECTIYLLKRNNRAQFMNFINKICQRIDRLSGSAKTQSPPEA